MTKKELVKLIGDIVYRDVPIKEYLYEFFEQNVCIPKGENRHPYADILHELVENSLLEYEVSQMNFISWGKGSRLHNTAYRIKPSEPEFEYQWYTVFNGLTHLDSRFYTLQEMIDFEHDVEWKKIEETKRLRTI